MDGEANLGLNKLAQVMQERMNRNQDANNGALILDFGTIQRLPHPQHAQPHLHPPRRDAAGHHGRGHRRSAGPPYPVRTDGRGRHP